MKKYKYFTQLWNCFGSCPECKLSWVHALFMEHQKRGQNIAMGHISERVQYWQHVSAPNTLTFCILLLPETKKACRTKMKLWIFRCHMKKWWFIRKGGAISGSSFTQILLGPICYDLFSIQWPSSLPKEERERHKEENPSNSTPWPISSVRWVQRFTSFPFLQRSDASKSPLPAYAPRT